MDKEVIDWKTYRRIYPQGSQPGKIYGMAKHHKDGCPMRPVLSAIGTPEYDLAKWLETQLKPLLYDKYSVASSSEFVNELSLLKPGPTDVCVSFDIRSLYTNVPLKEVIEDIIKVVYSTSTSSGNIFKHQDCKITKTVLRNMLILCSQSIFLYNKNVYKQCDGVAMGSPLAPLLANWFVCRTEDNILNNKQHHSYKPVIYKRYVDDIFAVFGSPEERDTFFNILNSAHPNLQFTMETANPNLPFLDVCITIDDGAYNTQVYRKPTNTGVLMNYECMAPTKWKKALIKCLLNRAYRVSSSFEYFSAEMVKIRNSLQRNGYPSTYINRIFHEFVESKNINVHNFRHRDGGEDQREERSMTSYLTIPYVGRPSIQLQHHIRKEMEKQEIVISASYSTTKVGSYFGLKPKCPILFKANVVYKFTCLRDEGTTYIGETRRQLFRRVNDHMGKDQNSAIFDHLYQCLECQSSKNISGQFEVLRSCDKSNILSFESLLISKYRPTLNTQLGPGNGAMVSLALYN